MFKLPIAHFSGKFHFQMPGYNNDPRNPGLPFDTAAPKDQVMNTCECDPAGYFEFLLDCRIMSITYQDGVVATDSRGDPAIGQQLALTGLLVDVSPSAICAVLHAGQITVGTFLTGQVPPAFQSDLRLCVRPEGFGDESAAAHYTVRVPVNLNSTGLPSRLLSELGIVNEIELHFHLNRYTRLDNMTAPPTARLSGDVYGYFRGLGPQVLNAQKVDNRRLVAHPELPKSPEIERVFLTNTGSTPLMRITDIDGYYDINTETKMLAIRYLNFIPFLDRNYTTPTSAATVKEYLVYLTGPNEIAIGRFVGDHPEMVRSGGIVVFSLPAADVDGDEFRLCVDAVTGDGMRHKLMMESEWDIELLSNRGLTLASAESTHVDAVVYFRNRTRLNRHLAHPDHSTGEIEAGEEVDGAAVVACGDVAKMLEFIEEALDPIAQPVGDGVMWNDDFARRFGRDDGFSAGFGDEVAQRVAIVGFVGNDAASAEVGQQLRCGGDVMCLAAGHNEAQGPTERVGDDMNFGGQSSSGTPQSLIAVPPFPVAACWWARTRVVSSMRYWLSGSPVRLPKTRSQTPAFAHRVKRLWTVFHLPYRSGRSLQRAPERRTHRTAFTNSRLSSPVRPGSPFFPGKKPSIRRHCSFDSSYRLTMCPAPNHSIRNAMNQSSVSLRILNVDWT